MRLQYTGQVPVSFMSLPSLGEVEPGAEFDVPDGVGEVLLLRADIKAADAGSASDSEPAPEPEAPTPAKPRKASPSKASDAIPAPADTV